MRGSLLAEGRTSVVVEWGPDLVAKVLRPAWPDEWAEVEARLTESVRSLGIRTPEVHDLIAVDGRPAIVMERISGPSIWQAMTEQPERCGDLMGTMVAIQREILACGLPEGVPALVGRLQGKIGAATELSAEERHEGCALVTSLPIGASLLHGDLHPGNVLLGPDGPVVIDWFDAAIGHPIADVIRSRLLIDPRACAGGVAHLPGATAPVLRQIHRSYEDRWADLLNAEAVHVPAWDAVLAAGRMSERTEGDGLFLRALWDARPVGVARSVAGDRRWTKPGETSGQET